MTSEPASTRIGTDRGCSRLRILAGRLADAGFETYLADLDTAGEPMVLGVTNPLSRTYAEVCAGDGGLELRCWGGPDDEELSAIASLAIRMLTTGPGDDPSAAMGSAGSGETAKAS
jgi:hypothetical protein